MANLLSNALDAVRTGGNVFFRSREGCRRNTGEQGIVITVADDGSGMNPETSARIFQAFYTTKGITGTGLGLWISSEILSRHNGSLQVRSRLGKGTVFMLFLPLSAVIRQP